MHIHNCLSNTYYCIRLLSFLYHLLKLYMCYSSLLTVFGLPCRSMSLWVIYMASMISPLSFSRRSKDSVTRSTFNGKGLLVFLAFIKAFLNIYCSFVPVKTVDISSLFIFVMTTASALPFRTDKIPSRVDIFRVLFCNSAKTISHKCLNFPCFQEIGGRNTCRGFFPGGRYSYVHEDICADGAIFISSKLLDVSQQTSSLRQFLGSQ